MRRRHVLWFHGNNTIGTHLCNDAQGPRTSDCKTEVSRLQILADSVVEENSPTSHFTRTV